MKTRAARFWAKVNKNGPIAPGMKTRCWLWTGATTAGYGALRDRDGATRRAHRVGWELQTGKKAPLGLNLCHRCDVRACIRETHLFVGTHADNTHDAMQKGRSSPPPVNVGAENGNSRLTEESVLEIRRLYSEGRRQTDLALRFQVSQPAISKIVRREWWKHI